MALKATIAPRIAIKGRILPKFPARVLGGDGISVTTSGGTYTFGLDINELTEFVSVADSDRDNLLAPVWNEDTSALGKVSLETILSSLVIASESEATLGTNNTKAMSPLRTKQAMLGGTFFTQSGGVTARNLPDLLRSLRVTPEDFGAVGNYDPDTYTGTDDAAAFNLMLDYVRTQFKDNDFGTPSFVQVVISLRPGAIYRISSTLNFTDLRCGPVQIYGNGATLYAHAISGGAVVDALHSMDVRWRDLTIFAPNSAFSGTGVQPDFGLVFGRIDADDASGNMFFNFRIAGWYNRASLYNILSEINVYHKCQFINCVDPTFVGTVLGGLAVHLTTTNESSYVSPFKSFGSPWPHGMNENLFINADINSLQGGAIRIKGTTSSCKFIGSYCNCGGAAPAVRLLGDHYHMELDLHVESQPSVTANVLLDRTAAGITLYNFKLQDTQTQATNVIASTGAVGTLNIINGRIELASAYADSVKVFATSSGVDFSGELHLGTTQAGLNNLSGANSFRGRVYTAAAAATIITNFPAAGVAEIFSHAENAATWHSPSGLPAIINGAIRSAGFNIRSSGSAFDISHRSGELGLSADRTINWVVGDANRGIILGADLTLTAFGATLVDDASASDARTTLGLGTISTQNANNVAITGGAVDGATVGATTATTGRFTSVGMRSSGGSNFTIDHVTSEAVAANRSINWVVGDSNRTINLAANLTLSAFGASLIDDADRDAALVTLGLTIGTNVQAFDADLSALAANSTDGLWARTGAGTGAARTLTEVSNRTTVTNGSGVSGNPTVDISASYVGQTSITTLGTIGTGTWTDGATISPAAFASYSPTVTATSGTFTTVSASGSFKQIGKLVFVKITITITTIGTAAGRLKVTTPTTTASGIFGASSMTGYCNNVPTALMGFNFDAADTFSVITAAGTFPGTSGDVLVLAGWYEAA